MRVLGFILYYNHIIYWIELDGTGVYINLIFQWLVTTGLNVDVRHFCFETNISQVAILNERFPPILSNVTCGFTTL